MQKTLVTLMFSAGFGVLAPVPAAAQLADAPMPSISRPTPSGPSLEETARWLNEFSGKPILKSGSAYMWRDFVQLDGCTLTLTKTSQGKSGGSFSGHRFIVNINDLDVQAAHETDAGKLGHGMWLDTYGERKLIREFHLDLRPLNGRIPDDIKVSSETLPSHFMEIYFGEEGSFGRVKNALVHASKLCAAAKAAAKPATKKPNEPF